MPLTSAKSQCHGQPVPTAAKAKAAVATAASNTQGEGLQLPLSLFMWNDFHNLTKDNPPSVSLIEAIKYVPNKITALDLGSGGFRDSKFLTKHFTKVIAVDKTRVIEVPEKVQFWHLPFQEFVFKKHTYDLINAQFSLPFMPFKKLSVVWPNIVDSLKPNGVFVGQFFGNEDGWIGYPYSFLNKQELEFLVKLNKFKIIEFKEIKRLGVLADGSPKKWHYFETILIKS